MPELPEVEALARFLDGRGRGLRVEAAEVAQIAALKTFDPPLDALVGRVGAGVGRRGKWLDLAFADPADLDDELHLLVHLSLGGWVRWFEKAPTTPLRPTSKGSGPALRLRFDEGVGLALTEAGTRKRLAVHVVRDAEEVPQVASLGIEPLSPGFTVEALIALLSARNQQVKGVLRDQRVVAGIGNAYSDEVLHVARMSPFKLTGSFTPTDAETLHAAIVDTLAEAVAAADGRPAAELKDATRRGMRVHGRTGRPCPECGQAVREVSFADRGLQYCATCQTGGRPLADRRMSRLLR